MKLNLPEWRWAVVVALGQVLLLLPAMAMLGMAGGAATAYGALGESLEQCSQRYGDPINAVRDPVKYKGAVVVQYRFETDTQLIYVTIAGNAVQAISYSRKNSPEGKRAYSSEELQILKNLNSEGSAWKTVEGKNAVVPKRDDKRATGIYDNKNIVYFYRDAYARHLLPAPTSKSPVPASSPSPSESQQQPGIPYAPQPSAVPAQP